MNSNDTDPQQPDRNRLSWRETHFRWMTEERLSFVVSSLRWRHVLGIMGLAVALLLIAASVDEARSEQDAWQYREEEPVALDENKTLLLHALTPRQIPVLPSEGLKSPLYLWASRTQAATGQSEILLSLMPEPGLLIVDSTGQAIDATLNVAPELGRGGARAVYLVQTTDLEDAQQMSGVTVHAWLRNGPGEPTITLGSSRYLMSLQDRDAATWLQWRRFFFANAEAWAALVVAIVGGVLTREFNKNTRQREEEEQARQMQGNIEQRLSEVSEMITIAPSQAIAELNRVGEYIEDQPSSVKPRLVGKFRMLRDGYVERLGTPALLEINELFRRGEDKKAKALLEDLSKLVPERNDLSALVSLLNQDAHINAVEALEAAFSLWEDSNVRVWEIVVRSIVIALESGIDIETSELTNDKFMSDPSIRILLSDPRLASFNILSRRGLAGGK